MKSILLMSAVLLSGAALASPCGNAPVMLRDDQGTIARVLESHDCWREEGSRDRCRRFGDLPRGARASGFRSHRVAYKGRDYAFVESWRRGSPAYVTGAFRWSPADVAEFVRVDFGFAGGRDDEARFEFSAAMAPPFASLALPPAELDGRRFVFAGCASR